MRLCYKAMRLCVNGHWINDDCRCLEFWQGEACDLRDCGHSGVRNDTDNGSCHCYNGHIGEFCEYEVCLHRNQWYCNATRLSQPSLWVQERHPCPRDLTDHWDHSRANTSSFGNCDCGYGKPIHNTTCLCQTGYYGEFCQWSQCAKGERWDALNNTCVTSAFDRNSTSGVHLGYFGHDVNLEFDISAAIFVALILIFAITGRLILRCLRKRGNDIRPPLHDVLRRRSTIADFYARFDRFLENTGPAVTPTPPRRNMVDRSLGVDLGGCSEETVPSPPLSNGPYKSTSAGPVLMDPQTLRAQEPAPPRSTGMRLETVYEGVPVVARPKCTFADE